MKEQTAAGPQHRPPHSGAQVRGQAPYKNHDKTISRGHQQQTPQHESQANNASHPMRRVWAAHPTASPGTKRETPRTKGTTTHTSGTSPMRNRGVWTGHSRASLGTIRESPCSSGNLPPRGYHDAKPRARNLKHVSKEERGNHRAQEQQEHRNRTGTAT